MIRNASKQAFLIVTPQISKHVLKLYHRLKKATGDLGDVYLLYHARDVGLTPAPHAGLSIETFTDDILTRLQYTPIKPMLVPGSNHFPVLDFYLKHPEYQYYWCIEDDVVFNGKWADFFSGLNGKTYDFISSHLRSYADLPRWWWWDTLHTGDEKINPSDLINSFNPIYRISGPALKFIDQCLKNGYRGHHEVLMPTILKKQGFSLADFSNKENHITPGLSLCTLRTMRWKPVFVIPGNQRNMLYHPVKPKITLKQLYVYVRRSLLNKKEYFT